MACALLWAGYASRLIRDGSIRMLPQSTAHSVFLRVGANKDLIELEDLLPRENNTFALEDLYTRLSPDDWAAVSAAAKDFVAGSPLNSQMWLILAMSELARRSSTQIAAAALKMSYFTAPNDITMAELRLMLALRLTAVLDAEFKDVLRREVGNLAFGTGSSKGTLVRIYCSALPDGRALLEEVGRELEPNPAKVWLRAC
jgi:hypothetical protein